MFTIFQVGTILKKAIIYLRHSAEDKQENSVPLQREFIHEFAKKHNIEIIHEEADEGVSGLTANRPGFQRLLNNWILNDDAPDFDYVIFYDVSRLGRFENSDEAGHYAYLCDQRGYEVVYARRGFEKQGMAQVQTAFERWMSFKYSEKLSEDVIRGCLEISSQGYSVGGKAPYGMARQLLSADGRKPIRILEDGEHKSVANERIRFVPKGDITTETVKRIFNRFLTGCISLQQIADEINNDGIPSALGGLWNSSKVHRILRNPVYKGTHIYNKNWGRLHRKKRRNPLADWVICPNAFEAIIDPVKFDEAQEQLYWTFPSSYLRGAHLLSRTRKQIVQEFGTLLKRWDMPYEYTRLIPVSFAIKQTDINGNPFWCFLISPAFENTKNVICISVDMDLEEPDRAFLVPVKEFDLRRACYIRAEQKNYADYLIKHEDFESVISAIAQDL
jgi:DNA invertase Pin-like site-specific DNA recombinase